MKKSLLSLMAMAIVGSAVPLSAQNAVVTQESITITEVPECDVHYYNTWRDGWFIQLGAGINLPVMEGFKHEKKHIGATYNLGFGRWFSPYFGFRFSGYYGNNVEGLGGGNLHYRTASINGDIMWDMCNSIGGVNLNRPVSVIPFVGIGGTYVHHFGGNTEARNVMDGGELRPNSWMLPVSAGIQFRFRLCKYVDFFLEARSSFAGDNFNNIAGDAPVDIAFQATGGLTFNIGGKSFKTYDPCADAAYIASLNDQVNDLRDELAVTAAALAAAESQLPCPEVKPAPAPEPVVEETPMLTTVRFTINSAKVSPMEMVNVYNVAEYMKAHPKAKVTITGYADKDTGTAAYNQKLSERRAQAVYDILVNNYGITADRLVKAAEGSTTQPYSTNNWNRIVIFGQE
ncbi:MAG: OmpA family protein [Bacteroides sp.]|nr:OmpA family protein [Bacteroides sp.]MCM1379944.1 OmpA family protein [Bacteroides sp.]MCM1446201.1 OmpA family protein [Prevotella sp.]